MKKRKTYRTKLEKLQFEKNLEEKYVTTEEECRKWFRILNREIFSSKLKEVNVIDIRQRRKAWAYYIYVIDTDDPNYALTKLHMNNKYLSKKHFVEVLAHEMIHHYQIMYGEPFGHGDSFFKWKNKFNKKGLRLLIGYGHEKL